MPPEPRQDGIVGRRCKRCGTIEAYGANYYGVPTGKCPLFLDSLSIWDYHEWESILLVPSDSPLRTGVAA